MSQLSPATAQNHYRRYVELAVFAFGITKSDGARWRLLAYAHRNFGIPLLQALKDPSTDPATRQVGLDQLAFMTWLARHPDPVGYYRALTHRLERNEPIGPDEFVPVEARHHYQGV